LNRGQRKLSARRTNISMLRKLTASVETLS
jgi:hypothetical protein